MLFEEIPQLLTPQVLIPWVLGLCFGVFVGSTPGLTATMAVAMIVPLSFHFADPTAGLAMIVGVSFTAIFSGDIPATFLRIPGTPASTAATVDAHALARQGRGQEALYANLVCSCVGGVIGVCALILIAPMLAKFALRFDDFEYFWLLVLGLSLCLIVGGRHPWKGMLSAALGILVATIGLDIVSGTPRFTLPGTPLSGELTGGIHFIPAMIGLFGLAEVLRWLAKPQGQRESAAPEQERPSLGRAIREVWRRKLLVVTSAGVGTVVGALPGAGADIAAWASYGMARRLSRGTSQFGQGDLRGVIAPTSANNAAIGGAWIPALVFGLPGDSVTAIVIGAFMMYDIQIGPQAFTTEGSQVRQLLAIALLTQFLLWPAGWVGIKAFGAVMRFPRPLIYGAVVVFSVVGSFAVNHSLFDVGVMILFGVLGFTLERRGVPLAPLILGMILGGQLEKRLRAGLISSQGDWMPFVTRPLCLLLIVLLVAALLGMIWGARSARRAHDPPPEKR